jgi:hypothetical protein
MLTTLIRRLDFWLATILGIVAISSAYYWLLLQSLSIRQFFVNTSGEPVYQYAVIILVPLVLILFGMNFGVGVFTWRAKRVVLHQGQTLLGGVVGSFGLACPICGSFLFSLLGISAGLSILPFIGLELWVLAAGLMGGALYQAMNNLSRSCEEDNKCWKLPMMNYKVNMVLLGGILLLGVPLSQKIYIREIVPLLQGEKIYPYCSIYAN